MEEILIRQYNSELEAREACAQLEAAGVHARVLTDLSGGQFPDLQIDCGVGLLVADSDVDLAVELLEELEDA
ncbi:MAG: hypothetical protein KDD66_13070 [Bdellovibrionales bacterium]|nr:hypothetical protein [Bdellovibrionales bacterium]